MKRLALYIFLVAILTGCGTTTPPFVEVSPKPKYHAWWLRTNYHPFGKEVHGIPVQEIHADWCTANEFTRDLFPQNLLKIKDYDMLYGVNGSFSLTQKFDGVTPLTALTGVYQTCDNKKGVFLLILDESKSDGKPMIIFKEIFEGKPTIAYFRMTDSDNSLHLYWCFDCGHFSVLNWNTEKRKFEWAEVKEPGAD